MVTTDSDKQKILNRIIRQEKITSKEAEKVLNSNIQNVKCIVTLWDYFLWCKENKILTTCVLNEESHSRILEIIKHKPYYDKSPYLSMSVHDAVLMSDSITYERYVQERGVKKKYPLHKVFLLDKKEQEYIQSLLQRGTQ